MPNWCSTRIKVYCEDKNKLKDFVELLESWINNDAKKNDFIGRWLGNIVINSGIGTVDTGKDTDLRCRGELSDYSYNDHDVLTLYTETAWAPMLKMWQKLFNEYLPEANWVYKADECGMAMYYTNDLAIVGKYVVDIWDDVGDYETDWEMEEKDVVKMLQDLLHINISNIRMLLKIFDESELSDHIGIHEWEWVDVDELD